MEIKQIENELNSMVCQIHNHQAKVSIEPHGTGHTIKIQNSCCAEFEKELTDTGVNLIQKAMNDDFIAGMKW